MINTLSPYKVTTPFVSTATGLTCSDYTLHIYIWDGAKATPPGTETITLTKKNPETSTGNDIIDIAKIIKDYIEFLPNTSASTSNLDGNNQMWVKHEVTYTTTNPADATTPQETTTVLAGRGYNYGYEEATLSTTAQTILMQKDGHKVNRSGYFCVPVLLHESNGTALTIVSSPSGEINTSTTLAATTDSSELVKYVWINLSDTTSDETVLITYNAVNTVTLLIQDENKYSPLDLVFQNKDGGQQVVTFFKEQRSGISITKESYESESGQPKDGYHQFKDYNVQGRTRYNLNSGWVNEEMNETFKQLMLSERVWKLGSSPTVFIPVNITSSSLEYKTRQKERLINYEIEIKDSYNEINNI